MIFQVTDAGRLLLDSMPDGVVITRADFGDAFNYSLPPNPTGLTGALVYSANVVWNPQIVDVNTLRYSILLANSLPSFAFGEVALYSDTTLLGVAVNAVMLNKVGPVSGSSGQTFKLDFFIGNAPGQQYAVGDVIGDQRAFARLPVPDLLKPPALNETNAYVIYGIGENDIPYFAFSDPTGKWSFSSKPSIYITGTISDVGTYGLQSFDITGSYPGPVTDLVLQFVSGTTRGYCRQVSSMVTDGIVWTTPMTDLPSVGDSFIILGPQVSSGGGGGITTADADNYTNFSSSPTSVHIPQTFGHYVNTSESGTSTRLSHTSLTAAGYNGGGNTALGYNSLTQIAYGNNNTAVGDLAISSMVGGDNNTAVGARALFSDATYLAGNSALGSYALSSLTDGSNNVAIGHRALSSASVLTDNVAVGAFALTNLWGQGGEGNGYRNVAVGAWSLTTSTTGTDNTALGYSAAHNATSAVRNTSVGKNSMYSLTTGYNNTASGAESMYSVTTGYNNTAVGNYALTSITTGHDNTAMGYCASQGLAMSVWTSAFGAYALQNNTAAYNSAFGYQALASNTTGSVNDAFGFRSLFANTTGARNTGLGNTSLTSNTTGTDNTGVGGALSHNTTGSFNSALGSTSLANQTSASFNVALGYAAGGTITIGNHNVAIGYSAGVQFYGADYNTAVGDQSGGSDDSAAISGTNNTFLGYNAKALTGAASNTITLGNGSITTLRCQVTTITALSDFRDKTDIVPLQQGLDFVMGLKPVSFTWNTRDGAKVGIKDSGFIAQDLKQSQDEVGAQDILKLVCEDDPEHLEASAGRLLPVLVKAIQDLTNQVNSLKAELAILKGA